jgi:hypothetical protein
MFEIPVLTRRRFNASFAGVLTAPGLSWGFGREAYDVETGKETQWSGLVPLA